MWIKTEDNENGGMEMSHWPRAIEIVNDERTGAKRYQFTYTAPTAYQDRTIIKRNPSNGSSFALSTPVGPANVRQADSRLARVVKKQHRQPGAHFAARPSNPNVPFRKQPRHCVRSPGMGSDHWCPFSGPSGGKYGAQYHSAGCCRSQARLLQRQIHKPYQQPPVFIPTRMSHTQQMPNVKSKTRRARKRHTRRRNALRTLAHLQAGIGPGEALQSDFVKQDREQSVRPTPMLEIHGLAARSIARQFWCPEDRTLLVYMVALLKRWSHMLKASLETGEQQFNNSELGLRQLWGFVCEKQAEVSSKENH